MIKQEKQTFRTDVESLLLEEMVEEDANFLIMGDNDDDTEAVVPDTLSPGLFADTSSDDLLNDEDDYEDDIFLGGDLDV